MRLGKFIEECWESGLGTEYIRDSELSKKIEDILKNEGVGGNMVVAANVLPLFLVYNVKPINHSLLNNNGNLEILTHNPAPLYRLRNVFSDFSIVEGKRVDKGKINVYYNRGKIKEGCEFAVLRDYSISINPGKFRLFNNHLLAKKYLKIFENMKKEPFVMKFDYTPLEPILNY